MSAHYTDADMQAATKATIGHRAETCLTGWLCQCGFTGDIASLDDHYASLVLDAVAPAIAARALREAARNVRGSDLVPDIPRSKVRKFLNDRADEIERATP